MLSLMSSARELFHQAIIESGSLVRTVPSREARLAAACASSKRHGGPLTLVPVLDGAMIPVNAWTNGAPDQVRKVRLRIGSNADEANYFIGDSVIEPAVDVQLEPRLVQAGAPVESRSAQAYTLLAQCRRLSEGTANA